MQIFDEENEAYLANNDNSEDKGQYVVNILQPKWHLSFWLNATKTLIFPMFYFIRF